MARKPLFWHLEVRHISDAIFFKTPINKIPQIEMIPFYTHQNFLNSNKTGFENILMASHLGQCC